MQMRTLMSGLLLIMLCLLSPVTPAQDQASLRVEVRTKEGTPIEGATAFIWTARPKEGPSIFCPSCYVDCGKRGVTDAGGAAEFADLDPTLLFNLMTVADGFTALESGFVNPADGVVKIQMEARPPRPEGPGHVVRARVVDAAGKPVAHASVTPVMFHFAQDGSSRAYGSSHVSGADPLALTDADGYFELTSPTKIDRVQAFVKARALCSQIVGSLKPDQPDQQVTLREGTSVSGTLLDDAGRPVAGRSVGLSQVNRGVDWYIGDFTIDTDEHGQFLFVNVPAEQEVYVYGKWTSISAVGAVEPIKIKTGADGQMSEGVQLSVKVGHTLRGRVVLADGKPIPKGKGVLLVSSNSIWDACPELILPEDGTFELRNLPTDSYDIGVRVDGYHISNQNPSFDTLNRTGLDGRIERSIDDFIILMDTGPMSWERPPQPADLPLRGYTGPLPGGGPKS